MAKIFETSPDIKEFIDNKFADLGHIINFKVLSLTKSKSIIKVAKANATTEFLTKSDGMVTIFIYEEAWDRLPDLGKEIISDLAYNQVMYDSEKDKITIEADPYRPLIPLRKKYGDDKVLNIVELQDFIIQDIEKEEKEKLQAEKEKKKSKKQFE